MIKEIDVIFLKVDSTLIKQLKGLVNNRKRRPSISNDATKEKNGLEMLRNLHKQGSFRISNIQSYNRTGLKNGLSALMIDEEEKNVNPFSFSKSKSKRTSGFAQLAIKDNNNVK